MLQCNWPFPSYLKPLFQSEAKCEAIDGKMIFHCHENKTHFHKKSFRVFGTQKWLIYYNL